MLYFDNNNPENSILKWVMQITSLKIKWKPLQNMKKNPCVSHSPAMYLFE